MGFRDLMEGDKEYIICLSYLIKMWSGKTLSMLDRWLCVVSNANHRMGQRPFGMQEGSAISLLKAIRGKVDQNLII